MDYQQHKEVMLSEVMAMREEGLLDQLGGSLGERLPDGNILMTPTTASFRRWEIKADELVVMDPKGDFVEGGSVCNGCSVSRRGDYAYIYRAHRARIWRFASTNFWS